MQTIFREIKSKICFRQIINPDFPAHVHDDIEMIYTKRGQGTAYCDGKKYTLADGTWFLAFPNQVHHYADCANGEYFLLIIKPSDLLRYGQNFLMGTPESAVAQLEKGQDNNMEYLLETAFGEYQKEGYSDVIAAYLTVIFGKLLPFLRLKSPYVWLPPHTPPLVMIGKASAGTL